MSEKGGGFVLIQVQASPPSLAWIAPAGTESSTQTISGMLVGVGVAGGVVGVEVGVEVVGVGLGDCVGVGVFVFS